MEPAELRELIGQYRRLQVSRDDLSAEMKQILATITDQMSVGERVEADLGDVRGYVGLRRGNRSVDTIALARAGIDPDEYSTITPSITKLRALADQRGWSEERLSRFLIESDETTATIRFITIEDEEFDQ